MEMLGDNEMQDFDDLVVEQVVPVEAQEETLPIGVLPEALFSRFLYTGQLKNSIPLICDFDLTQIANTLRCVMAIVEPNNIAPIRIPVDSPEPNSPDRNSPEPNPVEPNPVEPNPVEPNPAEPDPAEPRALLPINAIQQVYTNKMYLKVDFVLVALAYCTRQTQSSALRSAAYTAVSELLDNQFDFLMFVGYWRKISQQLHGNLGFGHGMRRAVQKWYGKYSPLELADMFGEHRASRKVAHKSVISKAHLRTKRKIKPVVQDVLVTDSVAEEAAALAAALAAAAAAAAEAAEAAAAEAAASNEAAQTAPVPSTSSASQESGASTSTAVPSTSSVNPSTSRSKGRPSKAKGRHWKQKGRARKSMARQSISSDAPSTSSDTPSTSSAVPSTSSDTPPAVASTSRDVPPAVASTSRDVPPAIPSTSRDVPPAIPSTSRDVPPAIPSTSRADPIIQPNPEQNLAEEEQGPDDRNLVFQFIMGSGREYLALLEQEESDLGPGSERMKQLQILKTNEDIESALTSIYLNDFSVEQIPAHLLEDRRVWEHFLPRFSPKQILKYFHTLRDFTFLNPGDVFHAYFLRWSRVKSIHENVETVSPIVALQHLRLYEKQKRHLSRTKSEYYERKVAQRGIINCPLIKEQLSLYFTQSLSEMKPIQANYFITMDLRTSNKLKPVLRNPDINCTEAMVLLAYSLYRRSKDVSIYTFGDKNDSPLKPIHQELHGKNFEEAMEICESIAIKRTYQSLLKPIAEATKLEKKVDVFVVIVDSVARFCRQGQVPQREFNDYKMRFNENAKFLVVNLKRNTHDLEIQNNRSMVGFFEMCGFGENVLKILTALGDHGLS